ncbi:hypothetical protein ACFQ0B_15000 [Nonomuraea thailandensis]
MEVEEPPIRIRSSVFLHFVVGLTMRAYRVFLCTQACTSEPADEAVATPPTVRSEAASAPTAASVIVRPPRTLIATAFLPRNE